MKTTMIYVMRLIFYQWEMQYKL